MDNQQTFQSGTPSTPAASNMASKPAKKSGKIILIVILCLVFGAAIATGIIVCINGGFNFGDKTNNASGNPSSSEDKDKDDDTEEAAIEEAAIEDADLAASLTKKTNVVIAGVISSERSLRNIEYSGNLGDYQSMSSEMKSKRFLSTSILSKDDSERVKVNDLPDSVANKKTLAEQAGGDYGLSSMKVTDDMKKEYKNIFGEELTMVKEVDASATTGCTFTYVPELSSYVALLLGCGGATDHWPMSYQVKYTKQGKKAYVYIALGQADSSATDYLYMRSDTSMNSGIVESFDNWDSFSAYKIDASNYTKYTLYRAVFEKNDDGNYIYKTFEKVNE